MKENLLSVTKSNGIAFGSRSVGHREMWQRGRKKTGLTAK